MIQVPNPFYLIIVFAPRCWSVSRPTRPAILLLVCCGSAGVSHFVEAWANVAVVVQPQYLALFPVWKKLSISNERIKYIDIKNLPWIWPLLDKIIKNLASGPNSLYAGPLNWELSGLRKKRVVPCSPSRPLAIPLISLPSSPRVSLFFPYVICHTLYDS